MIANLQVGEKPSPDRVKVDVVCLIMHGAFGAMTDPSTVERIVLISAKYWSVFLDFSSDNEH